MATGRGMHDTIEKAVPEGLASDLKQLWGTKNGKFVTWKPGHSPFSELAWKTADTLHDGLTALANSGSWALWNGLYTLHTQKRIHRARYHVNQEK
jgi:hypothetical protein